LSSTIFVFGNGHTFHRTITFTTTILNAFFNYWRLPWFTISIYFWIDNMLWWPFFEERNCTYFLQFVSCC
jgi:hypothetical protein